METDSSMEESFSEDIASDKEPPKELVSSAEEPCETEAASEELSGAILIIVAYEAFDPPNDQRYQENRQHDQTAKGDDPVAPNLASSVTSDFFLFHLFFAFPRRNAAACIQKVFYALPGEKTKKNPMGFSQPYNSAPPFFCNKKGNIFCWRE